MNYPEGSLCNQIERDGWPAPKTYNMGIEACDKWAKQTPGTAALILCDQDAVVTYRELKEQSNQVANLLALIGIGSGDRVGILLPQTLETALTHLAAFKLGAISVPLFVLFGPDALQHRVVDAGIKVIVTNCTEAAKLYQMDKEALDGLTIYTVDGLVELDGNGPTLDFKALLTVQSIDFQPVETTLSDPAIIIYTSGTTGPPKGALHGHSVLLGHMPGFEMFTSFSAAPGHVIWTPADWAWIGGLFDVLMPALASGMTVLANRFDKFTAEAAFHLMSVYEVQHSFLPPTALKLMRVVAPNSTPEKLSLISVGSGGEALGTELLEWGRKVINVDINEFYGQTEANLLISTSSALCPAKSGLTGLGVAGHEVAIIDQFGHRVPDGELGEIAVRSPDPVIMLNYWNNDEATASKFIGDWLLTGDIGIHEGDNWFRYVGRDDDVITSSGYRIGPGSIENCLMRHPSVQMAGVVGKPDPERTEIVVAFIVLKNGMSSSDELISELQTHVKKRLAAHEYPREIIILDDLPKTTTGKIMRRKLRDLWNDD